MTTLNDLVYDILSYMNGFGKDRDQDTYLTADLAINDLSFLVDEPQQVSRGIVEIDNEQIAVRGGNPDSGTVNIFPYGRGTNGTAPAVHLTGARVVSNPQWPTSQIKNEINRVVADLFPDLYCVKSTQLTWQPTIMGYSLPADCYSVISVRAQTLGGTGRWEPITRYRYDPVAFVGQYVTSRQIEILQGAAPGRLLNVVYRANFDEFTDGSQNMTDIGLQDGWRDLITLGVQQRLVGTLDVQRVQLTTVESVERAASIQPVASTQISKDLRTTYERRKLDESKRLLQQYPGLVTRTV